MRVFVKLSIVVLTVVFFLAVWIRQNPSYPDLGGPEDIKLLPVDQAGEVPEFAEFRSALMEALERKDLGFVLSCIDDTVRYTFGLNEGTVGFLRHWGLDTVAEQSRFWDEMLQVMRLGGTFIDSEQTVFMAPYVYTSFPERLDPFRHAAVVGCDVKVYTEPEFSAPVLGALSYSIIELLDHDGSYEIAGSGTVWRRIKARSGKTGFVQDELVRSPVDYRAAFAKTDTNWKLIFFVAGD